MIRLSERFWKYVNKTETCWLWTGAKVTNGYGTFYIGGKNTTAPAHRVIWEAINGLIPSDLLIDHICRVRHCVNPSHLRLVTNKENILCGFGRTAINARKTHCTRGHAFDKTNTYFNSKKNTRTCRHCSNEQNRIRRHKLRSIYYSEAK